MRRLLRWLLAPNRCAVGNCEQRVALGRRCMDHAVALAGDPWKG